MADLDKGGDPFEFVNTYFGPTIGWVRSRLLPTVTPPTQPIIPSGAGGGGGSGAIAVGSTPITGGANGSFLYDNVGVVGEQTAVQVTAQLGVFTATLKGLAPASGGGTANFLRADGAWALPPGGAPGGTSGQIEYNNAGAFGGFTMGGDATVNTATGALTIANGAVTYAKMQNVSASARFHGRITAGAGVVEELTGTQATTLLDPFTTALKGVAPASGGGTVNFLRADGAWAAPSVGAASIVVGTTTVSGGTTGNYAFNNAGIYGEKTPTQLTADINVFTTALKGAAPASGGGTVNFLRADGTWNAPPGAPAGAALTKTDDTNVTLTLGGTPATALLVATSITVGWAGTLGVTRGGTGLSSAATAGNVLQVSGVNTYTLAPVNLASSNAVSGNLPVGNLNGGTSASSGTFWRGDGTWAAATAGPAGSTTQIQYNNAGALGANANFTYNGTTTVTLGAVGATGLINLKGTTSGTVGITVAAAAGTWTMQLPAVPGTSGQLLRTDGAGICTWVTGSSAPGGATTQVQFNNAGALGGDAGWTYSGSGTTTMGAVGVGTALLNLKGTTSGTVGLTVAAAAGTWTMTLPTTGGTNLQFLQTNGSGVCTWATPSGGAGITIGTTTITSGTSGRPLYDNAGVVGELTTGNLLAVSAGAINANEAAASDYRTNVANKVLSPAAVWSAAGLVTITNASSVNLDLTTGFDFIWTIGQAGSTLVNPTNNQIGQKGMIYLVQDATGGRTITTWGSRWKFSGGTKPTLSTAPNAVDVLSYCCKSTTEVECFFTPNMT